MADSPSSPYIGQRLSFKDDPCTVRYVGELQDLSGEWLGVEWDNPDRGKHSGEHNGVKYFECRRRYSKTASFVRPNRPSDRPRKFIQALRLKYAPETLQPSEAGKYAYHAKPVRFSGKEAEEVGFEKVRRQLANLQELRIVLLDGMRIQQSSDIIEEIVTWPASEHAPLPSTSIRDVCPKLVELDLSRNLFERWEEVLSICEQLDRLREIRVNGNRFQDVALSAAKRQRYVSALNQIKFLSVDETLMMWDELAEITEVFPNLSYLSASGNIFGRIHQVSLPHTLATLILEDNNFSSLCDIEPIASLPNLQRLTLKNNSISATHGAADNIDLVFSTSLVDIDLSYNSIDSWAFIDALAGVFPGLVALRIASNPLYSGLSSPDGRALTVDDGYMLTISRLGQLESLNFSKIPAKERVNAEVYYLSSIGKELSARSQEQEASIIAHHPRYTELCSKYGDPTIRRTTEVMNPNSLAASLIRITFRLAGSLHNMVPADEPRSALLEIPKSASIYKVLGQVGQHFGLRPMGIQLVWETGEWDFLPPDPLSEDAEWDSEEEDEEGADESRGQRRISREVKIPASTKTIGTQVDGMEVSIRVEVKDSSYATTSEGKFPVPDVMAPWLKTPKETRS